MNYNLCIQIPSSFNPEISDDDKFNMLGNILSYFTLRLKENDSCISINEKESSYMLEGNQNITIQMKVKFQENLKKEQIKLLLKTLVPEQLGIVSFNPSKTVFGFCIDTLSNFMDSDTDSIITNISDLPENLQTIEFVGIFAESASSKPKLNINFFDKANKKFEITDSWVNTLKEVFSNTFSASDASDLPLSHLIRLMIGNKPSKELLGAINTTLMITTLYMDETMRFDDCKTLEDCTLFMDFD